MADGTLARIAGKAIEPVSDATAERIKATAEAAAEMVRADLSGSIAACGKARSLSDLWAADPNENVPTELGWLRAVNSTWHRTGAVAFNVVGNSIAHFGERLSRVILAAAVVGLLAWVATIIF